jgi:hypothetical protein
MRTSLCGLSISCRRRPKIFSKGAMAGLPRRRAEDTNTEELGHQANSLARPRRLTMAKSHLRRSALPAQWNKL